MAARAGGGGEALAAIGRRIARAPFKCKKSTTTSTTWRGQKTTIIEDDSMRNPTGTLGGEDIDGVQHRPRFSKLYILLLLIYKDIGGMMSIHNLNCYNPALIN